MGEHIDSNDIPLIANVDMSSGMQFHAVAIVDDNRVAPASHATTGAIRALGILMNKPKANEHAAVRVTGVAKFAAGAGVVQDGELAVLAGTGGFLDDAAVAGSGTTRYVLGIALSDVGSGGIGTMLIQPFARTPLV